MNFPRLQFKLIAFILVLMSIILTSSSPSLAQESGGASDGGGGDIIICENREKAGLSKASLADYYLGATWTMLPPSILSRLGGSPETLEALMMRFLELHEPAEAALLKSIELNYKFVSELEELNDDDIRLGLASAINRCVKLQLAVQNLNSGQVRIHQARYDLLNPFEKALLRIHERYINVLKKPGQSTQAIRKRTIDTIKLNAFNNFVIAVVANGDQAEINRLRMESVYYLIWEMGIAPFNMFGVNVAYLTYGYPKFDFNSTQRLYNRNACYSILWKKTEPSQISPLEMSSWINCAAGSIVEK